jgi:hypothetical protein
MFNLIDKQFTEALNKAYDLFDADQLEECQRAAIELLEDDAMPRYHRMKTLILLGTILGDWDEANECRIDAWSLYELVRRWHYKGDNGAADKLLDEIRTELVSLDDALREDAPDGYYDAEVGEAEDIALDNTLDTIDETTAELESLNMTEDAPSAIATEAEAIGCETSQGMR